MQTWIDRIDRILGLYIEVADRQYRSNQIPKILFILSIHVNFAKSRINPLQSPKP